MSGLRSKVLDMNHPLYKTVLCEHYLVRNCRLGDKCSFAHGERELRQTTPPRRRKNPCKWGSACFNKDSGCVFGHGTDDEDDDKVVRPSTSPTSRAAPTPSASPKKTSSTNLTTFPTLPAPKNPWSS